MNSWVDMLKCRSTMRNNIFEDFEKSINVMELIRIGRDRVMYFGGFGVIGLDLK